MAMISSRMLLAAVLVSIIRTIRLRRVISKLINTKNVVLFLLPADNRYAYPQITSIAKSAQVKVAIFPSWFANETELLSVISESTEYTAGLTKGLLRRLWSTHVMQITDRNEKPKPIIPFSKSEILSRKMFSAEVPNPWILHSTNADKILVETQTALNYARKLGFDDNKLVLTGSVFLDEMFSLRQIWLAGDSAEVKKKKTILSALPPDMFSYPVARNCEFRSYSDLVDAWCSALRGIPVPESDLVVALHPSTSSKIAKQVMNHGIHVSTEETHLLIAKSDYYIASISATIQWAISAGVPCLNYDVYNFGYPEYEDETLVTTVNSHREFILHLSSGEEVFSHKVQRNPSQFPPDNLNAFDGKSGVRLLAQIQDLVSIRREH
jgi:hypothetical protein